jgi:hypothetical protein
MAYSVLHGPPMKDATHEWVPATGTPPPVFNDINTDPEPIIYPAVALDNVANWRGLPELVDNRDPRTFGIGEVAYPSRQIGKTLVYECRLQGDDREDFILAQNEIVQGFPDQDGEGTMTVTPWTVPGGVVWTFSARVLDLQWDEAWKLDGEREVTYEWGFTLTLRMSDPRFWTGGVGYL